jgi:hypothetical protein
MNKTCASRSVEHKGRLNRAQTHHSRTRNPASPGEAARLVQQLVAKETEPLTRTALGLAMAGNDRCLLFCLSRVLPQRRPIDFKLPSIKSVHDIPAAMSGIITAVNDGRITAQEAGQLARVLESFAEAIKTYDTATRLEALEAQMKEANP